MSQCRSRRACASHHYGRPSLCRKPSPGQAASCGEAEVFGQSCKGIVKRATRRARMPRSGI
ncbi:hypothetical protein BIWAKO_04961 [Bosea sp. BIWAKO-01]|nr:hypothetical protein BIWAKO_04961 [Bosea sp. BIWAKO-01]